MLTSTIPNRQLKTLTVVSVFLCLCNLVISCTDSPKAEQKARRPNILLIVADDLGYSDLSCYGGEIPTPNIDQLAASGIRFSRFHSSPLCAPTRAMLLSGNDNHIAGMGNMFRFTGDFGYEGHLTDRIVTVPALLRESGYHTFMAGKWHLGRDSAYDPHSKGFEHSFVNLFGAGNHYNETGIEPDDPVTLYSEDGKRVHWKEGDYSTDFFTDKLIGYIDESRKDDKPFFGFAAYTSPHWPLQVAEKYWKKYEGKYDDGYEKLRARRLESLKKAGMIPADAVLPPLHPSVKPWDSLSAEEKRIESRKMELYAGMVDNLDYNVGRLIQHLKDIGEYDNTLIVFMSDNGAAGEAFEHLEGVREFISAHYNNAYENMGKASSFMSYGVPWAEAGTAAFKYYKGYTTEGGINVPMMITGPGVKKSNIISDVFVTLMDLAPTFYEAAGITYPKSYEGHAVYPLRGSSLLSFVGGSATEVHPADYVFGLEHNQRACIRKGNWKITNVASPFEEDRFELYDLSKDLSETRDLKASEPAKYQELMAEWKKFSEEIKADLGRR